MTSEVALGKIPQFQLPGSFQSRNDAGRLSVAPPTQVGPIQVLTYKAPVEVAEEEAK